MIIHVGGNGSYLGLIDVPMYSSYVDNWGEDDRLHSHWLEQAKSQAVLVWGTGFETDWRVEVHEGITARTGFRDIEGSIRCSGEALHLANYDSLTMAAQFDDYLLPDEETADYKIPVAAGLYHVRIVQTVDPREDWWKSLGDGPAFLLEYGHCVAPLPTWKETPWRW